MAENYEIISVDASNVDRQGFFCYMSKPKTPGYRQKRLWLEQRFAEGMKIKIIHEIGGRKVGFIEYLPGEYAWRAVQAPGWLVIHCLWVVGKGKGKGYGARLIQECLDDARQQGKQGVVMVASNRVWLAGPKIFLENGFVEVDQTPPFQLLVYRLAPGADPTFPKDWEARAARYGEGFTVLRTPQCPYIENAASLVMETAETLGAPARAVELQSADEVQRMSPSPYGVFAIVYNGRLLSYYYLTPDEIKTRIATLEA
ncbi:MAG: GNAT family N-acetyltransferase [Anaerolineales bacterium]|nr:GNAT family N-acetyltransferase [Anaerolineales bacterium]